MNRFFSRLRLSLIHIFPITQALVIIRGQKALKVEKMDYSKHPESSKLRDCKASAHIPEWRKDVYKRQLPT